MTSEFETKLKELKELQEKEAFAAIKTAEREQLAAEREQLAAEEILKEKQVAKEELIKFWRIKLRETVGKCEGILQKVNEQYLRDNWGKVSKADSGILHLETYLDWDESKSSDGSEEGKRITLGVGFRGMVPEKLESLESSEINKIFLAVGPEHNYVLENIEAENPHWQEKVQNRILEALLKSECGWYIEPRESYDGFAIGHL